MSERKPITLNNIHALMMVQKIHEKLNEYIGQPIDPNEDNVERLERNLIETTTAMIKKVDPEATTYLRMPRLSEGGHTILFSIYTSNPEKFGIEKIDLKMT